MGLMWAPKLTSYTSGLLLECKLEGHENNINELKKYECKREINELKKF